jgi:alkylation response protein AidB-like acyl-CoA dehydrogenase
MTDDRDPRVADYCDRIERMAPLVREHADRSERDAQLAAEIVEAMHAAGLFRIFLPAAMGGADLTVPQSLRVFEAMARIDGSAGWNLAICADGPLFGHFIARDAFDTVFRDPRAVIAGSLNPMGTQAIPCDEGWRYSGRATYVSGSAHATWIMVSSFILVDGSPQLSGGVPVMRAGVFPMRECRILDTWSVSGMRGTGSNDCVFENVLVTPEFSYELPDPRSTWQHGPFANVPLTTQIGGALAAVGLGIARHALDALMRLASIKIPAATRASLAQRPLAQIQLAEAEGLLQAARAYLHQAYDEAWRAGELPGAFDARARAAARLASVTAVKLAARAVDLVHDAAGTTAIQTSCDIERCWRDIHAVTQHVILSTGRFEIIGRVLLGLDPGMPII